MPFQKRLNWERVEGSFLKQSLLDMNDNLFGISSLTVVLVSLVRCLMVVVLYWPWPL